VGPQAKLKSLSKVELHSLADGLLHVDSSSVDRCVEFVIAETTNYWHDRARAMMCRRLKHCDLNSVQSQLLVSSVTGRLTTGVFSQQFKDQLRLALRLDETETIEAARRGMSSSLLHVRQYSQWVLMHEAEHNVA
jgi:hypothetical protein